MVTQREQYRPAGRERAGLAARKVAARIIGLVVDEGRSLDKATSDDGGLAALRLLPAHDRALARAIATAALRHRGEILQALDAMLDRKPPQKARHLLHTLHAAAAQILFLNVPDSAAVDLAVTAISEDGRTTRFAALANAVLRRLSRDKDTLSFDRSARGVFPPWLAAELRTDHGRETADAIAAAILEEPGVDLTLKHGSCNAAILPDGQILPTGSLRVLAGGSVDALPGYAEGLWWVQDAASAIPARLLGDVAGLDVLDLCAAPGGKTAQLAAAGGRVTALDQSPARLDRLRQNLSRLSLKAQVICADVLTHEPGRKFDAILLDAPCSSTGTIRRHPDVMWTKTREDVATLSQLQERMIRRAATWLKPGGRLVYANCSLLKAEGENLLAKLAADPQGLVPLPVTSSEIAGLAGLINGQGALRTLPSHWPNSENPKMAGLDGFFACRFTVS
jgi:16S rRNA (cytosine967-C5)-methyltransferase